MGFMTEMACGAQDSGSMGLMTRVACTQYMGVHWV